MLWPGLGLQWRKEWALVQASLAWREEFLCLLLMLCSKAFVDLAVLCLVALVEEPLRIPPGMFLVRCSSHSLCGKQCLKC